MINSAQYNIKGTNHFTPWPIETAKNDKPQSSRVTQSLILMHTELFENYQLVAKFSAADVAVCISHQEFSTIMIAFLTFLRKNHAKNFAETHNSGQKDIVCVLIIVGSSAVLTSIKSNHEWLGKPSS